ncbi:MAG TPA: phenylacetate--CoA ligase family protein [Chloroflexia bacterium]|nr:phenylacetate--CoA ligase family protein [Chloroflexia bacterium]
MLNQLIEDRPQIQKVVTLVKVLKELGRLRRRARWNRAEIDHYQQQNLAALRAFAYSNSSFYKEFHRGCQDAPLSELPVLTKTILMENFDRLVTDPQINQEQVRNYLAEGASDQYLGRYEVTATSGSTGNPGIFLYNAKEWTTVMASFGRAREWAGQKLALTHRSKMAVVSSTNDKNISARVGKSANSWFVPTLRLDATRSLEYLVEELNRWHPQVVVAYTSMAYYLALEQLAGHLTIHPAKVFTSSEVTTPQIRRTIEQAWGKVVFDEYATTETATIAAECTRHHGLHLFEDLLIVENVDKAYRPVPPGVFGDKLLVTVLFNHTQPLIRYEISDRVKFSPEERKCKLPYQVIQQIEGRQEDILVMAGKNQNYLQVHPNVFHAVMDTIPNKGWQVNQERDGCLRILLVETAGYHQALIEQTVRDNLTKALIDQGVGAVCITVEKVAAIPKAKSGKSPLVTAYQK